jgi:hypothetical protein
LVFCLRGDCFCLPAALAFGWSFACVALACLVAYGVGLSLIWVFGLSLICYWCISVAPVRGGHLLFFACRKEK